MAAGSPKSPSPLRIPLWAQPLPRAYLNFVGRRLLAFIETMQGVGAFSLITLGVICTKFNAAPRVLRPLIREQVYLSGLKLLPFITFLGLALGFVVVGQTVSLLSRVNVQNLAGTVMVSVVVRELGPILTALIVLARAGTANVIELGTSRARGEVEALEALNIDPVHYLVMPRVCGMAIGITVLSVYLIITALLSGYLFVFLQDVPLQPGDYFNQLAAALVWQDFLLLGLKTTGYGAIIAMVTCYEGLARPLRVEEIANASTRAVLLSVVGCVLLDALFIVVYLLL